MRVASAGSGELTAVILVRRWPYAGSLASDLCLRSHLCGICINDRWARRVPHVEDQMIEAAVTLPREGYVGSRFPSSAADSVSLLWLRQFGPLCPRAVVGCLLRVLGRAWVVFGTCRAQC